MTTTIDTAKLRRENSANIGTHRLVRDLCDALDEARELCDALVDADHALDEERAKVARLRGHLTSALVDAVHDLDCTLAAPPCVCWIAPAERSLAETAPKVLP